MGAEEDFELASLADGSLAPERRPALEAQVAASAELAGLLREQERAVALVRGAAAQLDAPAGLRARIDAQRRPRRRRIPARAAGTAAAPAAAIAAGIVFFTSGTQSQQFHAALEATALTPGARGAASLTKTASGWRIELAASGLPHLQNGRFYEAWLRNAGGVLVPIGTFNDGRRVTLWAGVSPKQFATLTVTRERADDEQGSSGQKVLVGTVDTR